MGYLLLLRGSRQIFKFCIPRDAFWCIFRAKKCLFGGHCKLNYKQEFSSSVISYVIDINSYFGDKKYPAQTLKVAGDLHRASGAFENPDHAVVVIKATGILYQASDSSNFLQERVNMFVARCSV